MAGSIRISAGRLLADLESLARIGGRPDGGVDRVAGSAADQEARRWLAARIAQAGLEAEVDPAGNVLGRVPGSAGPWLLLGSHTDTVPAGGRLDGAYGVVAALEVLRTLHQSANPLAAAVEVVSFHDEEGVHGRGLAGSRALAAGPHVSRLLGYLELHIEQGPRLEAAGLDLGVVDSICGIDRWEARVRGRANHAGTTPMAMRRDAGRAAARLVAGLRELLQAVDPEMTGNAGEIAFLPGAPNVVPGEARLVVELRSHDPAILERAGEELRGRLDHIAAEEGCTVELRGLGRLPPAPMDPAVTATLEEVCARGGHRWRRLASGAGHDAMSLAPSAPAGMLFVPSRGGISHAPDEHTDDHDLAIGAQILLEAALELVPTLRRRAGAGAAATAAQRGLDRLNRLDAASAEAELLGCCASRRWAAAVAGGRPYPTPAGLQAAAERAWWSLAEADWLEAFAAHPRIGERERAGAAARREQSGVASASAATLEALADGNRRYEARFGRTFLIFASGRSAGEMLAALRRRLDSDPETELRVAAGEQLEITRLRLQRLLAESGP